MERESLVGGSGGTRRQAELMCWGWGCLQCRGSLCHCRGKVQRANHIHSSYFYLGNYWRRFKKIVLQTFGVTNTPSLPSPEPCCRVSEWAMSSQQQVDRASGEAGFHLGQPPQRLLRCPQHARPPGCSSFRRWAPRGSVQEVPLAEVPSPSESSSSPGASSTCLWRPSFTAAGSSCLSSTPTCVASRHVGVTCRPPGCTHSPGLPSVTPCDG